MKVYKIEDGETHFVVADSEDDAIAVMASSGVCEAESPDAYRRDYDPIVERLADDYMIGIRNDDAGTKERRTALAWTAEGRGYLCGTCW